MKKILSLFLLTLVVVTLLIPFFCMPTFASENDLVLTSPNPLVFNSVIVAGDMEVPTDDIVGYPSYFFLDGNMTFGDYLFDIYKISVTIFKSKIAIDYYGDAYLQGELVIDDHFIRVYDNEWLVDDFNASYSVNVDELFLRTVYLDSSGITIEDPRNGVDVAAYWLADNSNFVSDTIPPDPEPEPPAVDPDTSNPYLSLWLRGVLPDSNSYVRVRGDEHSFIYDISGPGEFDEYSLNIDTVAYPPLENSQYPKPYYTVIVSGPVNVYVIWHDDSTETTKRIQITEDFQYVDLGNIPADFYIDVVENIDATSNTTISFELGVSSDVFLNAGVSRDWWQGYLEGFDNGYDVGYRDALEDCELGGLINSTLLAPINGLRSFILFNGVSLWDVLSAVICLFLLIAFLKLFAGG